MIAIVTPIFRGDGAYDLNAKVAFECSRNWGNAQARTAGEASERVGRRREERIVRAVLPTDL